MVGGPSLSISVQVCLIQIWTSWRTGNRTCACVEAYSHDNHQPLDSNVSWLIRDFWILVACLMVWRNPRLKAAPPHTSPSPAGRAMKCRPSLAIQKGKGSWNHCLPGWSSPREASWNLERPWMAAAVDGSATVSHVTSIIHLECAASCLVAPSSSGLVG